MPRCRIDGSQLWGTGASAPDTNATREHDVSATLARPGVDESRENAMQIDATIIAERQKFDARDLHNIAHRAPRARGGRRINTSPSLSVKRDGN